MELRDVSNTGFYGKRGIKFIGTKKKQLQITKLNLVAEKNRLIEHVIMFNGRLVKRKWGWYLVLLDRKHFKVKLLRFKCGGDISMQYHNLRSELWVFLGGSGIMRVDLATVGFPISSGDYYLADKGDWHKFQANRTTWVLEIQYGEKCVEEDIVRV